MSSNIPTTSRLPSHHKEQQMANQKELSRILRDIKHDLTLNGILALGKDGILRSLTADREVVDAVSLRPELMKALLDRMPYDPQAEIDYRGVDGTKTSKEQWFHPDRSLLPLSYTPPEERRNLSPKKLEENRRMLEKRKEKQCEPQIVSDYDLGIGERGTE
ncbi:hypothetical protein CJF31_00008470 [Rutstroemia sp. NJR-2017a BVV2]|nr:hypothetical protein CJF31_00008470 [Rutstroemia sp. NJR-2017a BVV2]